MYFEDFKKLIGILLKDNKEIVTYARQGKFTTIPTIMVTFAIGPISIVTEETHMTIMVITDVTIEDFKVWLKEHTTLLTHP